MEAGAFWWMNGVRKLKPGMMSRHNIMQLICLGRYTKRGLDATELEKGTKVR